MYYTSKSVFIYRHKTIALVNEPAQTYFSEQAQGFIELGILEKLVHKVFRWQDKRL